MMVGHAALAFALAGWLASRCGFPARRALLFAVTAGAFAVVPDVDMGYAFVGIATAGTLDPSVLQETFWDAGLTVHRGLTHSLLVGGAGALAFGLIAHRGTKRLVGASLLAGLVIATFAFAGGLTAGVIVSFALAGVVVAEAARRYELAPRLVLAGALIGVLSHPFGDLFTGTAPSLFAPLDIRLLPTRITLAPDPTIHLLAAFGIEIATIWLALAVYTRIREQHKPLSSYIHHRAVLGAGYGAVVVALPPPTLAVSYHFVGSVLAVSLVGISADLPIPNVRSTESRWRIFLTGLAAVTVAWLAYGIAYLVVSVPA